MATNQFSLAQMNTYLDDRQQKGFTALLIEAPGALFTSQTPRYLDVDGNAPFNPTSYSAAAWQTPVAAYWARVDYFIAGARSRGMVVLLNPAYLGFGGGSGSSGDQGWDFQVKGATDANLFAYGQWLGNRYGNSNVIWCFWGDYNDPAPAKQWKIVEGLRTVDPDAVITVHTSRDNEAAARAGSLPGFNCNNIYVPTTGVAHALAASAYARSGAMPFFMIEGAYEDGTNDAECRRQVYQSLLGGACGHFFSNTIMWGCGADTNVGGPGIGPAACLASYLTTTVTNQMAHVRALFTAYPWWRLEPRTDSSLVTTALGSGASRVCPALANDGSFAMIWKPSSGSLTVNLGSLTPQRVRARFFDTVTGTYGTVSGSPFANAGTRSFTWPAERVLVLDAA